MNDIWQLFGGAVGGITGSGLVAVIISIWISRLDRRQEQSEREVADLKDKRVTKLETQLDRHIENDKSPEILTEIRIIGGNQHKMDAKLDRIAEETAAQGANQERDREFINNINGALQKHKLEDHRK